MLKSLLIPLLRWFEGLRARVQTHADNFDRRGDTPDSASRLRDSRLAERLEDRLLFDAAPLAAVGEGLDVGGGHFDDLTPVILSPSSDVNSSAAQGPSITFWKDEVNQFQVGDKWHYTYDITIRNTGDSDLLNINLYEDLDDTWGDKFERRISIVYNSCVLPDHRQPTLNIAMWSQTDDPYNGIDSNQLFNGDGHLKVGEEFSIQITVELNCQFLDGSPPLGDTRVEAVVDGPTGGTVSFGADPPDDDQDDPDQDDPGQDDPGQDDPGQDDPGQDDPGQDDPGQDDPGQDDPGQDDPGQDDPGQDDPGQDDPGQDDPGQDDPGQDDPGQDDPGQDDPGQDDPGQDDPGQDDPADDPPEDEDGEDGSSDEPDDSQLDDEVDETDDMFADEDAQSTPSNSTQDILSFEFGFDSLNNQAEESRRNRAERFVDPSQSKQIFAMASEPVFSGFARPGTSVYCRLVDSAGNVCGESHCVADAGGNWLLKIHCQVVNEYYRVEFATRSSIADVYGYLGFDPPNSTYVELGTTSTGSLANLDRSVKTSNDGASLHILKSDSLRNNRPQGFGRYSDAA